MYTIIWYDNNYDNTGAKLLRREVFVDEQGYSIEMEFDETDNTCLHIELLSENNITIACARLIKEKNNIVRFGRIAVKKSYRKKGIGRIIVEKMQEKAVKLCANTVVLDAQVRYKGFYEALGFAENGDPFMEGHVEHITMCKKI